MNPTLIGVASLLSEPKTRDVLNMVATKKYLRLSDLIKLGLSKEAALDVIDNLKAASLIKETSAPIPDLKTYFITAEGLQARRELL